jgi:hypothetical protein
MDRVNEMSRNSRRDGLSRSNAPVHPIGGHEAKKTWSNEENPEMRLITAIVGIALLSSMFWCSSPALATELDEHLEFLKPLMGKEWVGGFVGSGSPDIQIRLLFEQVLGGNAVRYVREAEAVGYSALTHIYWNPGRQEVCFLSLNNKGTVDEGVVNVEDGRIVLRGKSHRDDETIEFKTTWEIDPKGTLRDTFLRMEGNEWVRGHLQEFVTEK